MKAFEIHEFGIENMRRMEHDVPKAGAGQVVVRLRAASLNYRDVMVVEGKYNPRMKLPAVPLSDAAGEVVETGSDVTKWRIGERVCSTVIPAWRDGGPTAAAARSAIGAGNAPGVLREYAAFDQDALVRAPQGLSFAEAATLPCAAVTAWNALSISGKVKSGDTVLTLGTGGVSVFAIQFAKFFGARVISTSSSDEKLEKAKEIGADDTINYRNVDDWDKAVRDLTDGMGVDHVIEVGGTGTLARSVRSVRVGGHIALIGALDMAGEFNPIPVFMNAIRMQGIFVGSRSMFEAMNEDITSGGIHPVIDSRFAFDDAFQALKYMRTGSHFGKIVIEY